MAEEVESRDRQARDIMAGNEILNGVIDYNSVEAILLACGVLVCLSGLIFASERFATPELRAVYRTEYDALAYAVVLIILLSLVYFFTCVLVELFISITPDSARRCLASCSSNKKQAIANAKSGTAVKPGAPGAG